MAYSLASSGWDGKVASGDAPLISADGRFVVFMSTGTNLVPGQPGQTGDYMNVFLKDINTGAIKCLSTTTTGQIAKSYSVPLGISPDGRFVAFASWASLVPDGDTTGLDLFIKDVSSGGIRRVPLVEGDQFGGLSADGSSALLFNSAGWKLIDVESGASEASFAGSITSARLSSDGRFVAYGGRYAGGDAPPGYAQKDVITRYLDIYDVTTNSVERITSNVRDAFRYNYSDYYVSDVLSDGETIAFESRNYSDGFPTTAVKSVGTMLATNDGIQQIGVRSHRDSNSSDFDAKANAPDLSEDGRFIVFDDGFGRFQTLDLQTNIVSAPGATVAQASIADNGWVAFSSLDATFVAEDDNDRPDVFVRVDEVGTGGADFIVGSNAPDMINGQGGNDILVGNGSNDTISGGLGRDQVRYAGQAAEFAVFRGFDRAIVSDRKAEGFDEGQDIVKLDVEALRFAGGFVALAHDSVDPRFRTDFNGDAQTDLLFRNTDGRAAVWLMNRGDLGSITQIGAPDPSESIKAVADFNGDGKSDLLWQTADGMIGVWLMDGSTPIAQQPIVRVGPEWSVAGLGDFNGDGKADVLWRNSANSGVSVWQMDEASIASSGTVGAAGSEWQVKGIGDFDADGKSDIFWFNDNGASVLYTMNGLSASATPLASVDPAYWRPAGLGDFNGGSRQDVLWRSADGLVADWLMDGPTIASSGVLAAIGDPNGWELVGQQDLSGDGKTDLVWRDTLGNTAAWLMDGTRLAGSGYLATAPGLDWTPVDVADVTGDGRADILWRNNITGAVVDWEMDGLTLTSGHYVAAADLTWNTQNDYLLA